MYKLLLDNKINLLFLFISFLCLIGIVGIENISFKIDDRLLFDRPDYPIFVNETPCNAQYFDYDDDTRTVAMLFEEWKEWITKKAGKDSEQ